MIYGKGGPYGKLSKRRIIPLSSRIQPLLEGHLATVQVMKRGITLPFAPPDRLREAETVPLHPAGRLHTLR